MATDLNPSLVSYVDDAFYADTMAQFQNWQRDDRAVLDPVRLERIRATLFREARLLDQLLLDDWLKMFADLCLYWVPGAPNGGDPKREIMVSFDDRRRIEDRVYRLKTGYAWSQLPISRTNRIIGNVEAFTTDQDSTCMVRSNFTIREFQDGSTRTLSGWYAHRLRQKAAGWEIVAKEVNLLDCDQNMRYPTIIL